MPYLRRNAWELGGDWADPILWYARGVAAMRRRPLADPASWRFYSAIYGFDPRLWQKLGWLRPSDAPPAKDLIALYWNQGKAHVRNPAWHRAYLLGFEANLRAAIAPLGGPGDWALPYWNIRAAGQSDLPPAFASSDWPDGHGDNPLYSAQRYGASNNGREALADRALRSALQDDAEDAVRTRIGGTDPHPPHLPGLMSEPETAALDPIFWLHHADLDRRWTGSRHDLRSVPGSGDADRRFAMPMPGAVRRDFTPDEMGDTASLDYRYDDRSAK